MPLTDDVLGTNADGTKNEDYCMYCYKDGKFLQDCTMEEMIEHCAQFHHEGRIHRTDEDVLPATEALAQGTNDYRCST